MNTVENQTALAAIDRGLSSIAPNLWIAHRRRTLKQEACCMQLGINIAKTTSLTGAVVAGGVGLLLGATGIGLVGGGLAGLTYLAAVVCDGLDTGRFAPLPFVRTRLADRLETMGSAELRALRAQYDAAQLGRARFDGEEELYSNLPPELSNEAMLLTKHGGLVASLLTQLAPDQRDLAYLHICDLHQRFGDALTGLSLPRLKDAVAGRVGGNPTLMRPAEISEYEPPVYQMQSGGRPFGELPAAGNDTGQSAITIPGAAAPKTNDAATLTALKQYIQQPKNLVVVASGGAGKGITLANLCRFKHEADSRAITIWCDPKNDPEESGYFDHPSIRAFRFNAAALSASGLCQKIRALMSYYRMICDSLPAKTPVWLILDEWLFVLTQLKKHDEALLDEVTSMLVATVSLLDAKHKHIVLVGQSPNLNDLLPGQGGVMANLNTLCLFKRDSSGVKILEKAGQTGVMPRADATADNLYKVAAQSPRKRAMYFGDRLWPVPELVNYGNYDRDRQTHTGKPPTVQNFADTPLPATAEVTDFDPDAIQPNAGTAARLNRVLGVSGEVHPKVRRFAEVAISYLEGNGLRSVGLSQIINSNAKLKALRAQGRKDVIERMLKAADVAGLLSAIDGPTGWTVSGPTGTTDDSYDFDF